MKKILVAVVVVGLFMPLMSGGAQEKKGKTAEERFAALDKNNDKKLSKDEYLAQYTDDAKKEKGATRFGTWDKDKDGFLSLEEFKAGIEMQKKKN
jgi:Ca2+-binding EF-hand superfamily protein